MLLDKYNQKKQSADEQNNIFYSLSAAVYSVCEDLGEDEARFAQYLNYGIEGFREWHIDSAKTFEVKEIRMNDAKQIVVPPEMVDWVVVGVKCGNTIKTFTNDQFIPRSFDKDAQNNNKLNAPCDDIDDLIVSDQVVPFGWDYQNGSGWGNKYFGLSAQSNGFGYFDFDRRNRVINFKETIDKYKTIYLEYLSDGLNYNGKTVINPLAFKLIKLYIKWMRKENSDRAPLYEKRRAEDLYYKELSDVNMRMLDFSIEDAREALREAYTLIPRN